MKSRERKVHRKLTSSPAKSYNNFPKVIKIIVTDPYATDSSSDDDEESNNNRGVKRYVEEIRFYDREKPTTKYRGVRQRPWGKFAAEIRDPSTRNRIWIGTFDTAKEAAIGYDQVAIRLNGYKAQTNFLNPPLETEEIDLETVSMDSGRESQISLRSPTSVLKEETEYKTEHMKIVQSRASPANSLSDQFFLPELFLSGDCFWETEIGIEESLFLDELQWLPNRDPNLPEIIPIDEFSDVDEFFKDHLFDLSFPSS